MADRNAAGALEVITAPDYEAMVVGAHPDDAELKAGGVAAAGVAITGCSPRDCAEGSRGCGTAGGWK